MLLFREGVYWLDLNKLLGAGEDCEEEAEFADGSDWGILNRTPLLPLVEALVLKVP